MGNLILQVYKSPFKVGKVTRFQIGDSLVNVSLGNLAQYLQITITFNNFYNKLEACIYRGIITSQ